MTTAPEIYDDWGSTLHDQSYSGYVYGYDSDGDSLTYSSSGSPSSGSVTLQSDGSYTYTPNAGYVGSDQFTVEVTDGFETAQATVYIDVYNTAPEIYDDYGSRDIR